MEKEEKFKGKVTVELKEQITADHLWPLLSDFCNLHKWLTSIDTCYQVDGEPNKPGLTRYCAATTVTHSSSGDKEAHTGWAKERLVMIDPIQRCFSYEILENENNIGFKNYVATVKIVPVTCGEREKIGIEWSFVADAIEGWTLENLVSYVDSSLRLMANKFEEAILSG